MMNYLKKNFLNSGIIVTTLISFSLWFSLGTKLQIDEKLLIEKKILLENFRYIFPFIILILITILKKENKNLKKLKFIILIIFASCLIGYINFYFLNDNYLYNLTQDEVLIGNGYIPDKTKDFIFCFYFIVTFLIFIKLNNEEVKKINIINYIFVIIISLVTLYYAFEEYFKNTNYYLYNADFLVQGEILGVSSSKSLGLSRNLVIITIPLMIFCFFFKKKNIIEYLAYFILTIIIALIIHSQSRTSNYFFYFLVFLIFFIKIMQKEYKDLIIIFFVTIIIPFILTHTIPKIKIYFVNQTLLENDNRLEKNDNRLEKKDNRLEKKDNRLEKKDNRLLSINPNNLTEYQDIKNYNLNAYTSGRINLWKKTIEIFFNEENLKFKILGFGPRSDRYLIKENLSNALIYFFLAGGLLGLVGILLLYATSIKEVIKFISFKKNISSDLLGYSSIVILIFLIARSLVENSFAVFGTDHIIFITNLIFIKNKNNKIFKKIL